MGFCVWDQVFKDFFKFLSLRSLVDLRDGSTTWGMKTTPPLGSSEEYQAMCESMTYQISGDEEDSIVKSIRT